MVCFFVQRCGEFSPSTPLFPFTNSFTHKMWHIKLMDRQSVFENNRKWHICLFLLGLHIRRWDAEKSDTQLSETVCVSHPACVCSVRIAINLCFEISKSASCLSKIQRRTSTQSLSVRRFPRESPSPFLLPWILILIKSTEWQSRSYKWKRKKKLNRL